MDRRRNKRNNNWNNQKKNEQQNKNQPAQKTFQFNSAAYEDENATKERQEAIRSLKERELKCPICGLLITDISSSMADKNSKEPVHFECAMNEVSKNEKLEENEKIAYIGQGRFGVLYYENPRDQRHFTIKRIIEWEDRDSKPQWRDEISGLYSQVK